jgi:hypothetical protein
MEEHLYTLEPYERTGIELFLEHIKDYLAGKRTVPVSMAPIANCDNYVTFTFSNHLMEIFLEKPQSLKKPYEVALKYGFRGYSKGGKNGIFYVRKSDTGLLRAMPALMKSHSSEIKLDLRSGLDGLKNVKIVWHNPSGERVVGVYKNSRILFLDFASY